jgi:hypothetical protein
MQLEKTTNTPVLTFLYPIFTHDATVVVYGLSITSMVYSLEPTV